MTINSKQIHALSARLQLKANEAKQSDDWGCDSNNFHDVATPDNILSLLAERDADKALIAQLREHNRILAGDGIIKQDRIAELEARTLTVKLPQRQEPTSSGHYGDGYLVPNNSGSALDYEETIDALQEACAAAGITLVVGE